MAEELRQACAAALVGKGEPSLVQGIAVAASAIALVAEVRAGRAALLTRAEKAEPTPEQIEAYLRGSADWHQAPSEESRWRWRAGHFSVYVGERDARRILCKLGKIEGVTPAEMRARILGAGSGTADPDRLAKVAEPTDDDLLNLFERAEYASGDTRAARRALYDLGREHGRAEREVAPTPHVPDGETRDRPATLTAAEMAAELREAGWSEGSGWRSPRDTLFAWHRYTADAYAAMRAAKGAK
jgi:hypothetical protein